jgi:hypothetical protein
MLEKELCDSDEPGRGCAQAGVEAKKKLRTDADVPGRPQLQGFQLMA